MRYGALFACAAAALSLGACTQKMDTTPEAAATAAANSAASAGEANKPK